LAAVIEESEFQENLKRLIFLEGKNKFPDLKEPSRIFLAPNANGEMNLQIKETEDFIYSKEDIKKEAEDWFSALSLDSIKILYVFGIGLGYYYEAAKKWLHANPTRFIIFLEDDKEMLFHFLHAPLAKEILHDGQARVHLMENQEALVDHLSTVFLFDPYKITALNDYKNRRNLNLEGLKQEFAYFFYSKQSRMAEYLSGGGSFYVNYYHNLQFLSDSYFGNGLFEQFKGVPAIICGAGPSLNKNIETLKTLKDRALIIAGGSAINALNSHHLFPHFTVGIDPNPTQLTRILANNAYETPFFYRNRIHTDALFVASPERLYLTGSGGYDVPSWFENKLGIKAGPFIDEGYNVINFAVSIAKNLGCNPIILCGLDLAYTEGRSYIPGLKLHALHNFKRTFITKGEQDELVGFKDIYGKETTTLWKWINEASWFALFSESNPQIKLINATEGGIGFPNVENIPLAEVADTYLDKQYDFESLIHTEIQNSHFGNQTTGANVLKAMKLLRKSLGNCEVYLKELLEKALSLVHKKLEDKSYDLEPFLEDLAAVDKKLRDEDYYKAVLKQFANHYFWMFEQRMDYFLYDQDKELKDNKIMSRLQLEVDCGQFLKSVMQLNKCILEDAIRRYPKKEPLKKTKVKKRAVEKEPLNHLEKKVSYYPSKEIKSEAYFENGLLEGFCYYFAKSGNLLAKSFYSKGKREGKSYFYYENGQLFAAKNFKNGLLEGSQEFYYANGRKKALISYSQEKLDGIVLLYYPNGQLKREIHFKNGERDGIEKMWSPAGALMIEAFYKEDKPEGVANWWYGNGVLKQKSSHHENTNDFHIQFFMPDGKEIFEKEDYFDHLIKITNSFTESIETILKQTDLIMPHLANMDKDVIETSKLELKALEAEMTKLLELNEKIKANFSGNSHAMEEPIWKSSALQAKIDEQLNGLIQAMKTEVKAIQDLIQKEIDKII